MKLLVVAPYLTIDGFRRFEKNRTGFGHMVWLICRTMAAIGNDVTVITKSGFGKADEKDGVKLVGNSLGSLLCSLFVNNKDVTFQLFSPCFERGKVKLIYDYLFSLRVLSVVDRGFDVVHLHGINDVTKAIVSAWPVSKAGLILTLHGFRSPSLNANDAEFQVILMCLKKGGVVTAISSGVKKKLVELINNSRLAERIHVISNGVYSERDQTDMLTPIFDSGVCNILLVGNITKNKNQIQALRAIPLLSDEIRKRLVLHVIGHEHDGGDLRRYAKKNNLEAQVVFHGYLCRNDISSLYHKAHGVLCLSHMEGFGMPLCEAMTFGVPLAMFSDLDAAQDIFVDGCGVLMECRDDKAVADAITLLAAMKWDRGFIRKQATKFTFEEMGAHYMQAYELAVI